VFFDKFGGKQKNNRLPKGFKHFCQFRGSSSKAGVVNICGATTFSRMTSCRMAFSKIKVSIRHFAVTFNIVPIRITNVLQIWCFLTNLAGNRKIIIFKRILTLLPILGSSSKAGLVKVCGATTFSRMKSCRMAFSKMTDSRRE
jgi:hypothetical protein